MVAHEKPFPHRQAIITISTGSACLTVLAAGEKPVNPNDLPVSYGADPKSLKEDVPGYANACSLASAQANGAGIGEIVQSGTGPKTLNDVITEFARLAKKENGEAITFTDSDLKALYARIRADINAGRNITAGDRAALSALAHSAGDGGTSVPAQTQTQAQQIETAIGRVDTIRDEVVRLGMFNGGRACYPRVDSRQQNATKKIAQCAILTETGRRFDQMWLSKTISNRQGATA